MLVKNLMQRQTGEGSWVSPNPRPPLEFYSFSATALMVSAIQYYSPRFFENRKLHQRIEKARAWMIRTSSGNERRKSFSNTRT